MFSPDSRYVNQATEVVTLADGTQVATVIPPLPNPVPLVGYHPRVGQERLDLVAVQYLNAATGFWRLCDANNSMLGNALAARALIGIPQGVAT
ncbi:MAG: LysM domain-containing protein [Solirubrobacteraceae bacterium]